MRKKKSLADISIFSRLTAKIFPGYQHTAIKSNCVYFTTLSSHLSLLLAFLSLPLQHISYSSATVMLIFLTARPYRFAFPSCASCVLSLHYFRSFLQQISYSSSNLVLLFFIARSCGFKFLFVLSYVLLLPFFCCPSWNKERVKQISTINWVWLYI